MDDLSTKKQKTGEEMETDESEFLSKLGNILAARPTEKAIKVKEEEGEIINSSMELSSEMDAVTSVGESRSEDEEVTFTPAANMDTVFPFSKQFAFEPHLGRVLTLNDYIRHGPKDKYKIKDEFVVQEVSGLQFYKNVPWMQLYNENPWPRSDLDLDYDISLGWLEKIEQNRPHALLKTLVASKAVETRGRFDFDILRYRRVVVFNDLLVFLFSLLKDRKDVKDQGEYMKTVMDGVYGANLKLNDKNQQLGCGGFLSTVSSMFENDTSVNTISQCLGKLTTDEQYLKLFGTLIYEAIAINDYDTRYGFISDMKFVDDADRYLYELKNDMKLFKMLVGIKLNDPNETYRSWMEQFASFMVTVRNDPGSQGFQQRLAGALGNFLPSAPAGMQAFGSAIRQVAAALRPEERNALADEIATFERAHQVIDLKAKQTILALNEYTKAFEKKIKLFDQVYNQQREEIKKLKKRIKELETNGPDIKTVKKETPLSQLPVAARAYLGALIKSFLMGMPLMRLVYGVTGVSQLKDPSAFLVVNLPQLVLERLVEKHSGDEEGWWKEMTSVSEEVTGDDDYLDSLLSSLQKDTDEKEFLRMAETVMALPLHSAFLETMQFVGLLWKKSSRKPLGLMALVTKGGMEGVQEEMSVLMSAIMTKGQDTQKQHATTRFDKPGLNLGLVNAKVAIKMKMEIHLGFDFRSVEKRELLV